MKLNLLLIFSVFLVLFFHVHSKALPTLTISNETSTARPEESKGHEDVKEHVSEDHSEASHLPKTTTTPAEDLTSPAVETTTKSLTDLMDHLDHDFLAWVFDRYLNVKIPDDLGVKHGVEKRDENNHNQTQEVEVLDFIVTIKTLPLGEDFYYTDFSPFRLLSDEKLTRKKRDQSLKILKKNLIRGLRDVGNDIKKENSQKNFGKIKNKREISIEEFLKLKFGSHNGHHKGKESRTCLKQNSEEITLIRDGIRRKEMAGEDRGKSRRRREEIKNDAKDKINILERYSVGMFEPEAGKNFSDPNYLKRIAYRRIEPARIHMDSFLPMDWFYTLTIPGLIGMSVFVLFCCCCLRPSGICCECIFKERKSKPKPKKDAEEDDDKELEIAVKPHT